MCFQTLESIDLLPFFYYSFHLETKSKEISNVWDKHELDSENGLVSKVDLTLKNSHVVDIFVWSEVCLNIAVVIHNDDIAVRIM